MPWRYELAYWGWNHFEDTKWAEVEAKSLKDAKIRFMNAPGYLTPGKPKGFKRRPIGFRVLKVTYIKKYSYGKLPKSASAAIV